MSNSLFDPLPLGTLTLPNRIAMAPMTRCRSAQPGNIATASMARYYAQRASAGLIISEAMQISPQGQGYSFTPGIHSVEQVQGWQQVTDAVHQAGGRIFAQLWHVGRMSHHQFQQGKAPVAPSAITADAQVWVANDQGEGQMLPCSPPTALSQQQIDDIIDDYRRAARAAMEAGFDGVEIHAANGYLIDQFLRSTSNQRDDVYGGSIENRARFLLQVSKAVTEEIGAHRVGVRLAPFITARGMNCPDIIDTIGYAARQLNQLSLAYLHLAEADWDDAPNVPWSFRQQLRADFDGVLMVAGGYQQDQAEQLLATGLVDLVAFGRAFIANPDLPERLLNAWPLAEFDPATLFGGNEQGYCDYPSFSEEKLTPNTINNRG